MFGAPVSQNVKFELLAAREAQIRRFEKYLTENDHSTIFGVSFSRHSFWSLHWRGSKMAIYLYDDFYTY